MLDVFVPYCCKSEQRFLGNYDLPSLKLLKEVVSSWALPREHLLYIGLLKLGHLLRRRLKMVTLYSVSSVEKQNDSSLLRYLLYMSYLPHYVVGLGDFIPFSHGRFFRCEQVLERLMIAVAYLDYFAFSSLNKVSFLLSEFCGEFAGLVSCLRIGVSPVVCFRSSNLRCFGSSRGVGGFVFSALSS